MKLDLNDEILSLSPLKPGNDGQGLSGGRQQALEVFKVAGRACWIGLVREGSSKKVGLEVGE